MRFLTVPEAVLAAAAFHGLFWSAAARDDHLSATSPPKTTYNVAVIGAGAAGSSAAYYLSHFARQENISVSLTVFERASRAGGRSTTVNVHDNPLEPVEVGASIFVPPNPILLHAVKRLGLPTQKASSGERSLVAVWDGDEFVFHEEEDSWEWWSWTKLLWKYGLAPRRTLKLVRATVAKYLKLYDAPYFPFRSLTQRAFELGFEPMTRVTGREYLTQNGIADPFAAQIVQAGTRVNYATNLGDMHGLLAVVSLAVEGAMSVLGGNWRIFDGMVRESKAGLLLNTSVTAIELEPIRDPGLIHERFILKSQSTDPSGESEETSSQLFDKVVIATPYQYSNITTAGDVIQHPIEEVPYVTLHSTVFTSAFLISPGFYNFAPIPKVPSNILTTLAESDDPSPGASWAGKAGFFAVQTLRTVTNPWTKRDEFLYHIFSPEEITPEFLSSLLGVDIPETFTDKDKAQRTAGAATNRVEPISWYSAHAWHAFPQAKPRVAFQDPIIRAGLFYTSGMDPFISSMESNALMGMNVARLIVDDLVSRERGYRQSPAINEVGDGGQKAINKEWEDL